MEYRTFLEPPWEPCVQGVNLRGEHLGPGHGLQPQYQIHHHSSHNPRTILLRAEMPQERIEPTLTFLI